MRGATNPKGPAQRRAKVASGSTGSTSLERQRVTIEVSADFDAVLYVRKGDMRRRRERSRLQRRFGGTQASRVETVLEPGMYFVFVDGNGDEVGELSSSRHDP